jgi:hypothetical protein
MRFGTRSAACELYTALRERPPDPGLCPDGPAAIRSPSEVALGGGGLWPLPSSPQADVAAYPETRNFLAGGSTPRLRYALALAARQPPVGVPAAETHCAAEKMHRGPIWAHRGNHSWSSQSPTSNHTGAWSLVCSYHRKCLSTSAFTIRCEVAELRRSDGCEGVRRDHRSCENNPRTCSCVGCHKTFATRPSNLARQSC